MMYTSLVFAKQV